MLAFQSRGTGYSISCTATALACSSVPAPANDQHVRQTADKRVIHCAAPPPPHPRRLTLAAFAKKIKSAFVCWVIGRGTDETETALSPLVQPPRVTFVKQRVVDGDSVAVFGRRSVADGHLLILRPVLKGHHGPLSCCGDGGCEK